MPVQHEVCRLTNFLGWRQRWVARDFISPRPDAFARSQINPETYASDAIRAPRALGAVAGPEVMRAAACA